MTYDSTQDTLNHKNEVALLLSHFSEWLAKRAWEHDISKLKPPEKELFDKYVPLLKETTYGSEEYNQYLSEMGVALQHHYENNFHHPESKKNGIDGMNLVDIVEMLCDWKAASMRHADGDFLESLRHNKERFGISNQLYNILVNTASVLEGETKQCG